MVRKKIAPKGDDFGQKFFWFLVTAYVADCVGLLNEDRKHKFDELVEGYDTGDWRAQVREGTGVDAEFVTSVYKLCRASGKTEAESLDFILRGFGCPEPEERMVEVMG